MPLPTVYRLGHKCNALASVFPWPLRLCSIRSFFVGRWNSQFFGERNVAAAATNNLEPTHTHERIHS